MASKIRQNQSQRDFRRFPLIILAFAAAIGRCHTQQDCGIGQFQCSPQNRNQIGRCISAQWRCDGELDCPNGDDEKDCRQDDELVTTRTGGASGNSRTDLGATPSPCSLPDCGGNSTVDSIDETMSFCQPNEFQCASGDPPKCFPIQYRCDHDHDCPDGSDENGCLADNIDDPLTNQTICLPLEEYNSNASMTCEDGIPSIKCSFGSQEISAEDSVQKTSTGNGTCSCDLGFQAVHADPDTMKVVNASAMGSKVVCIDEDECTMLGPDLCSHFCTNTFGSYRCKCAEGYHLSPDGHTCKAYGKPMVLVFSNSTEIFLSNGNAQSAIVTKLANANDLAMEYSRNVIYWSDSTTRRIQRSAVIRPSAPAAYPKDDVIVEDIIAPNGLTVDWLRRLLFWVDGGRRLIEVADLNSPAMFRRAIVWEDIFRPRDIVCHPGLGFLFWAEWGYENHRARIERINMDGSDPNIIAHKQVYRPCGLVVDFATNRLYWVDAEKLSLESSDLQGRHRTYIIPEQNRGSLTAIAPSSRLLQPIACAVYEAFAYVSDQAERAVYRVRRHPLPRDANDIVLHPFTTHTFSKLGSLLVFHNATQPTFQITSCSATGLNCSQLCLPRGSNQYSCACVTGYTLQPDNITCLPPDISIGYIYLQFEQRLSRISLEGPDYVDRTFFSLPIEDDEGSRISSFDVNLASSTFWFAKRYSADQMLSLYVASLPKSFSDVPKPRQVLTLGTDHSASGHFEVAVDWITGNIYMLLAATGRIEVVAPDGIVNHRTVVAWTLISKEAHCLSLQPREGVMFWIDTASSPKASSELGTLAVGESFFIIRCGLDGSRLTQFLEIGPASSDSSHRPFLVVADDRLFWTSDKNHAIISVKLDGTDRQVHIESANRQPSLLAVKNSKFYFYDAVESALFSTLLSRNFSTLNIRSVLEGVKTMKIRSHVRSQQNPCKQTGCSQLCLLSPDVIGYRCACFIGYTLRQDGTTCSRNFDNLLLVAHGQSDLLQIDLTTPYSVSLPLSLNPAPQNVVAVVADPTMSSVCWADNGRKLVACSAQDLDASSSVSEVVATELDSVESIAYDYLNKNLYMVDTLKPQIAVVHIPTGQLRLLLMRFTINQPRSLALSLQGGYIFWTELNSAGTAGTGARIGRVDMDGSNAITIVDNGLGWPQGITVDSSNQRLFWGDQHFGRIESCDFEGDKRAIFLSSVNPYGLVVVGQDLYWTDPESRSIRAVSISNFSTSMASWKLTTPSALETHSSNPEPSIMRTIVSDTKNLFGLSALSKITTDSQLAACDLNCVGLCLRRPNGHRCVCPTGFQPTSTAASCQPVTSKILLIVAENAVSLVFIEDLTSGNSQKQVSAKFSAVVLTRPSEEQIVDADFDWNSANNPLYYATSSLNSSSIYRINLSGFRKERLLTVPNATILSLAIDVTSANVYWFETRWSTTLTYLRVASLDKQFTKTLLTSGFEQPKDLAVHPGRGRLFWINLAGPAAIETSLGDGSERRVLVPRSEYAPASLSLDVSNNLLYWTDTLSSWLHVSDLNGKLVQTISSGVARQAGVLAVSPTHIFWTSGKGKIVNYSAKNELGSNNPLRLTEMHQVIRGIGIYSQPAWPTVDRPLASAICSNSCAFICLQRGESQIVCTCPDSISESVSVPKCNGDDILNSSSADLLPKLPFNEQTTSVIPYSGSTNQQSLIALIGVGILLVFVIVVVILALCRHRLIRHQQHRRRSRSDSFLSVLLCYPCLWNLPSRTDRARSTSPHANLTSTISGNFAAHDDDPSLALMTVSHEKGTERGGLDSAGGDSSNNSTGGRNRPTRQSQTVVSLRFDASDGADNITVKRVETVL